ncbi:hypothetical protein BDK88_0524 [Natrinema hispanicum]|uniref:Uncharacterized protein n=1 Tax=Natrinema hispanicum TaxID=392421 RepID=A0A482YA64_9EURY|nr:hypothetical protein [Natrinema hispanicum]RZV11644.1 hypothetical protein BDK88_0524 [Natrinema hispanicum]
MTPSTRSSGTLERLIERARRVVTRFASPTDGPAGGWLRPTAAGGLLVVLASVTMSLAAAPVLGDSVRIRWSIGTYYGPEYAPTPLALATFPALVAVIYVGFRALVWGLERAGAFDATDDLVRSVYELCALVTLLALVFVQIVFIVANLL